jgi:hypothetical protein
MICAAQEYNFAWCSCACDGRWRFDKRDVGGGMLLV